jgi:hypothetical protein
LSASVWCGLGAFGIYVYLRHRRYVQDLPSSTGNRSIKRTHGFVLGGALVCFGFAIWQIAKLLIQ